MISRRNRSVAGTRQAFGSHGVLVVAVVLAALVVGLPQLLVGTQFPITEVRAIGNGAAPGSSDAESAEMIEKAEASLREGAGPADGSSVNCTGSGTSATCSSVTSTQAGTTTPATATSPSFPTFSTPTSRYGAPWTNVIQTTSSGT